VRRHAVATYRSEVHGKLPLLDFSELEKEGFFEPKLFQNSG
jgi:hypothetical protein